jgi:hypothetical protein
MEGDNYQNELYQNAPNQSLMYTMYTTTFGNGSFMIQPPQPGKIGNAFPTIPYLSIEALIYQQQASNPSMSPINTMSGSHVGQQVISGQYTMQDQNQTNRYQQGFQSGQ